MALPETDLARIRRWVAERNDWTGEHINEMRVEMDVGPGSVTIFECRPPWRADFGPEWTRFPIARLRYVKAREEWSIYWRDRNLKFNLYDRVRPTPSVETLLDEISSDPIAIFWG